MRPQPGRPPRISLDQIVRTAMVMDPDRLTMHAVAAQLDVSTSALYRWVTDREHLLDLVSAELRSRITATEQPTEENWREWLIEHAHSMRTGLLEVPGFAVRLLTGPHRHHGQHGVEEFVVRAFEFGGASEELARQYWHVYSSAIIGWVASEQNTRYPFTEPPDFEVLINVLIHGMFKELRA